MFSDNTNAWFNGDVNKAVETNHTLNDICGLMTKEDYEKLETCEFWMEGVLLLVTGSKYI